MALDLEKQQSARKRKRKRTKIKLYLREKVEDLEKQQFARKRRRKRTKIKLYLHEKVEVRIEEDGFQGSWHPGTVIACRRQDLDLKYEVKYDHILNDDESDYLVDQVRVSLSVDDTDCANEDRCNNRGLIRPPPPPFQFGKYCLPYGMCVDVHYQEAWWEGVIFDHDDGSEERKVFFPDLGDEIMARFNKLRVTQDWNEVDETWRQRGTWLFLVLIEEYEQKQYNPVSIKQLWHDLREKENFEKLGGWTSAVEALWRELVLEAIDDNLKVVSNHLFQVTDIPDATQQPLKIAKPVNGVDINRKEDLVETHAMIPVENSLNDCFLNSTSNKINGSSPGPACIQSSWLGAGPDIVPGSEFCPDAIIKYAQMGNKKPRGTLIKDVRNHLVHQRWKIELMKGKGKSRLRYTSPVGKLYHSLRQVCLDFCDSDNGIFSPTSEGKQNSSHTSRGDSSSLIEQQPKEWDPTCCSQVTSSSNSEAVVYEPEYCHEAIVEWRNLWSKHGSREEIQGKD
ncbi:FINGER TRANSCRIPTION FACTOR putative-RELATED [Salix koriyanagi]|uniref:FINGER TRANSCRIPTION FACTOR putative-RELATED n=1 Tax=Salix koriyanagi TaxID=2511006 RepID=A0A9Q0Z038_9ROSI|nr:FINGER TRANSCRIPTION FACTOR putative-RELATED [Salix koriyanagi]